MSSASNDIGASAHNGRNEWNGAFAFTNIGKPGAAFEANEWNKKNPLKKELRKTFSKLLKYGREDGREPLGIVVCGIGNSCSPMSAKGKHK